MSSEKTVLIVDDDPGFAYAVWRHFGAHKLRVTTANGSTEALEKLKQQKFDVVVTDIRFGRSEPNGLELAKTIQTQFSNLPVLLVTAYPELVSGTSPATKVLYKPVDLPLLRRAVERLAA